ncbi:E3 ubiquitin-protein ligase HECW2 [Toxocara canis]|uniref:E3 ubiquitin-protein ligase n=1 Tax=Toxocara canis TaxID=6265 RepID=A0A0B2VED0_TOXCA|nr:E3 ubiquitin-protein ligase HECW2 [Toxocara canis]
MHSMGNADRNKFSDECNPLHYMDYKSYGVCGPRQGSVAWTLCGSSFQNRPQTYVCFRYFDGLTGALRASSSPLLVYNAARIVVDGIHCKQLPCKNASVYAKIRCGSSCYRTPTSDTASWSNLNFVFTIDRSRELQFSIKERCWPGDRVIGEANMPVADLVMQSNQEMAFVLRPANSSKQFNCHVILSVHVIPEQHDFVDTDEHVNIASTIVDAPLSHEDNFCLSGSTTGSSLARSDEASTSSANCRRQLPSGWEARVDRYGRIFYMDHANKRTTWHAPETLRNSNLNEICKRYVCARRTVIGGPSYGTSSLNSNNQDTTAFPPIKFLQRHDFITLLHCNQEALQLYNESPYLKHIIHRIRKDASKFERFKQNRELVDFLNLFADETQPLPNGWQVNEELDKQRLFVDHFGRRTTLIDPRLPMPIKRRTRSAPPIRRRHDFNGNTIMDIVHRTAELQALAQTRMPDIAPRLCRKLQIIRRQGQSALARFANDIDLISALSVLESEVNDNQSSFDDKLENFYASLQRSGYGQGPSKIRFRLRRSHLLNDAYDQMLAADPMMLRKARISVTFDEEEGLDYGGPSRELFFLLSRELFNPYYGLFEYSANDTYTVQISPMSVFVDNHLKWMELCGRILGLALVHRCLIDTFFTRAFYKLLLQVPFTISDLQSLDSQFHNSLLWIKENEITPDMELTFSTTQDIGGEIIEKELITDGKNQLVTEENKHDFISLMVKWRIERGVEEQSRALLKGLHQVIEPEYLHVFDGDQLELILSGTVEIDIEDWRENTEYKGGYYPDHVCIEWFWNTVYAMTNADRLKLLQFVTGTSSIPYEGFRALRGSSGPKRFTIEKWGSEDSLPRAHTCFNRLDLPPYPTQQRLNAKLRIAINESITYAIE